MQPTMDVNSSNSQQTQRKLEPLRVLVLEDDKSQWPLWEKVIKDIRPNAEIDWNTSEVNAEALLLDAFHSDSPYAAVISDIFLDGKETGIDLWSRYAETARNFIFVSILSQSQFNLLMESRLVSKLGSPIYLQKPLSLNLCKKIITEIVTAQGGENE